MDDIPAGFRSCFLCAGDVLCRVGRVLLIPLKMLQTADGYRNELKHTLSQNREQPYWWGLVTHRHSNTHTQTHTHTQSPPEDTAAIDQLWT